MLLSRSVIFSLSAFQYRILSTLFSYLLWLKKEKTKQEQLGSQGCVRRHSILKIVPEWEIYGTRSRLREGKHEGFDDMFLKGQTKPVPKKTNTLWFQSYEVPRFHQIHKDSTMLVARGSGEEEKGNCLMCMVSVLQDEERLVARSRKCT